VLSVSEIVRIVEIEANYSVFLKIFVLRCKIFVFKGSAISYTVVYIINMTVLCIYINFILDIPFIFRA
jgi:hypothetical protein